MDQVLGPRKRRRRALKRPVYHRLHGRRARRGISRIRRRALRIRRPVRLRERLHERRLGRHNRDLGPTSARRTRNQGAVRTNAGPSPFSTNQ